MVYHVNAISRNLNVSGVRNPHKVNHYISIASKDSANGVKADRGTVT